MLKAGIVGLPNVGKSTLFNALTRSRKAEAANYPFCTIDPNVGVVVVPDERAYVLQTIAKTKVVVPAAIEFVDIAGLVAGASKGEGLGNQFLATIREVDAIVQVVRCFEDNDIIHTMGGVDPVRDIEVITTELILADLDAVSGSTINAAGGLVLPEYAKYVADIQRDEAYTLKQRRLWAEESRSSASGPGADGSGRPHEPRKDRDKGKDSGRRGGRGKGSGKAAAGAGRGAPAEG